MHEANATITPLVVPTSIVLSAVQMQGWGTLVYLSGNLSHDRYGIKPWHVPQGIGSVVYIETGEATPAHTYTNR